MRYTKEIVAQADEETLAYLKTADDAILAALRRMPNSTASLFMASDARDLDRAVRMVQTVRSMALQVRAARERNA